MLTVLRNIFKKRITKSYLTKTGWEFTEKDPFTDKPVWTKGKYNVPYARIEGDRFVYFPNEHKCLYLNDVTWDNVKYVDDLELLVNADVKYQKALDDALLTKKTDDPRK